MTMAYDQWRQAWEQEIRMRLESLDRDESRLMDWEDALADIRRSLLADELERRGHSYKPGQRLPEA